MAISKLQPVTTSSGGVNTTYWTVPLPAKQYRSDLNLSVGIYQITTYPTSYKAYVQFLDASKNVILQTETVSGTVSVNLGTTAKYMVFWTNDGANVLMGITQTGNNGIFTGVSGTLDTITTTSTYTQTGELLVMVVGGGGGGVGGMQYTGGGGGGGGVNGAYVKTTTPTSITIGAGGAGTETTQNNGGLSGGTTSFGNFVSATGGGGASYSSGGGGGSPFGGRGGGYDQSDGSACSNLFTSIKTGTTGGGGRGEGGQGGGDSGIGKGGSSNATGTGYGSGGGGGNYNNINGGKAGTNGVCYVLRNLTWA